MQETVKKNFSIMRKFFRILALCSLLTACGNSMVLDGTRYQVFGLVNEEAQRDHKVIYEMSAESVIVAIIFCETIIVPIYVIGWDLYQPVRLKSNENFSN